MSEVTTPRMPGWMLAHSGEHLTIERLRLRLSAYVYGNILVLAAIVIATGKSIVGGEAALLVSVTALTTYVAHILAHNVGQQLGRERHAHRPHMVHEIQDALPILVSGVVPAAILFVATFSVVPTQFAQLTAAVWVVGRLALIGFLVERLSGRRPTWRTLSGGLGLALACAIVVVLKVLFAH
ncbi:MAG: hypothetical protein KIT89_12910 [Microcella sp.]|uniref:hypothetical protein n=1 Tax=Microcella sp. TaxID=1913979 RepID=UPI0024C71658|nr:hypothetical protein [Microcella sp.]UYN83560.1 MAG: hypothetical protein KIT89_12910 [Microcella sp.]